jgi:hypothetical protein
MVRATSGSVAVGRHATIPWCIACATVVAWMTVAPPRTRVVLIGLIA